MIKKIIAIVSLALILSSLNLSYASEKAIRNSYEYGKLVIMHMRSHDKTGNYESTTTIYFSYGDGEEISSFKSQKDILGIDTDRDAFKDFIKKYDQGKKIPDKPSEMSILNILGKDGWEIIYFSDAPAKFKDGTAPQSTYLLKRIK